MDQPDQSSGVTLPALPDLPELADDVDVPVPATLVLLIGADSAVRAWRDKNAKAEAPHVNLWLRSAEAVDAEYAAEIEVAPNVEVRILPGWHYYPRGEIEVAVSVLRERREAVRRRHRLEPGSTVVTAADPELAELIAWLLTIDTATPGDRVRLLGERTDRIRGELYAIRCKAAADAWAHAGRPATRSMGEAFGTSDVNAAKMIAAGRASAGETAPTP